MGRTKASNWLVAGSHVKSCSVRFAHTVLALNASDIGDLLNVEESSNAGQQTLAEGSVASDNVGEFALLDVLNQEGSIVFGETLYVEKRSG